MRLLFFLLLAAGSLGLPHAAVAASRPALDVPYVPTHPATVDAMLRLANVGPDDFVIDLGSGDGRVLITAAKRYGARGFGVDLDPERVRESIENARHAGVSQRVSFSQRNLFETAIGEATVVTMYLLPRVNLELRPRLLKELRPGTRIVSHAFDMGDWKPDLRAKVRGTEAEVLLWIVPARVAGVWRVQVSSDGGSVEEYELDVTQTFQELNIVARRGGEQVLVIDPRIDGNAVSLVLVDRGAASYRRRFEGRLEGGAITGTARAEGSARRGEYQWRATRKPE